MAPELIVYDNACALQSYCMRRLPFFFANTRFRVDKLHYGNHKFCSEAFRFSAWSEKNILPYSTMNTNAAEHVNRPLKRHRIAVSYMMATNAILYLEMVMRRAVCEVVAKVADMGAGMAAASSAGPVAVAARAGRRMGWGR